MTERRHKPQGSLRRRTEALQALMGMVGLLRIVQALHDHHLRFPACHLKPREHLLKPLAREAAPFQHKAERLTGRHRVRAAHVHRHRRKFHQRHPGGVNLFRLRRQHQWWQVLSNSTCLPGTQALRFQIPHHPDCPIHRARA